jgi:hypothetical protein
VKVKAIRPPRAPFAGIAMRRASTESQQRAHRNTKRHWSDRRLAAKLDDLLGSADDVEEKAEG